MPADKQIEQSLAAQSTQQLSTRASLVKRGLQHISEHLTADAISAAQEQSMALYQQHRIEEAIATCNVGLGMAPTDEILWQIKGVCLAEQGNYAEALDCIDRALQENTENPYCWSIKASILAKANRYIDAVACDDCAIELEPENSFFQKEKRNHLAAHRKSVPDGLRTAGQADAIEWTEPAIVLTIYSWYVEPMAQCPGVRAINFICEPENISDNPQRLGKEIAVFHRSKATGKLSSIGDAIFLAFSPALELPPQSADGPLQLELVLACDESTSDENCVRGILSDSHDLLAFDHKFETTIIFYYKLEPESAGD